MKRKEKENTSKVDIVAHSMDGLVSRAYIENGDFGGDFFGGDLYKKKCQEAHYAWNSKLVKSNDISYQGHID